MCSLRHGLTREVLLVARWAIKVPTLRYGSRQFVLGLLANLNERELSEAAAGDRRLAAVRWCSPLGLVAVQERVGPPIGRLLTPEERAAMPLRDFCGSPLVDSHNVAEREDGTLVCFDYGADGVYTDSATSDP